MRSSAIYQIFPRNYTEAGTLEAAGERLDDVAELGFDYVYLTPVHPIGLERRKGSLGSPYAIADYRRVDPLLGGEDALAGFIKKAHGLGLGVIMDIVYNHTSPDALLVREHPEWYHKGPSGKPGPRVADWSDVADLDYSQKALWDYQIETLETWARFGADGFRCDVASLVPVEFWVEARKALARARAEAWRGPGEPRPLLWIAESVHKEFVTECRRRGIPAASDPELHAAFDLSYDYDGREELEGAWRGELSLACYLRHLAVQEALYPERAVKLRFLENHDQGRAAARFGRGARLRNWTLFAMLLPGAFMAYMGEELAMERRIGLFDKETMRPEEGEPAFRPFFAQALALAKKAKAEAPLFDAELLVEGVVLVVLRGEGSRYSALLNLDGRSGRVALPADSRLEGRSLLGPAPERFGASLELGAEPLLLASGNG
jgi:glycosidase